MEWTEECGRTDSWDRGLLKRNIGDIIGAIWLLKLLEKIRVRRMRT